MRCLLEVSVRGVRHMMRCPPYEVSVREVSARCMRCLLERCPPYEVSVREVSAI